MDWDKPRYGRLLRVLVFITWVLRAARVFFRNLLCAGACSCMCMWFFNGRHLSCSVPPLFLTCWWCLVFFLLPTPPLLFLVYLAQAPRVCLLPFHLWSLLRLTTSQWLWFSPFCFLFLRLQTNSCFWFWKIFGNVSWSKLLCQHFSFNTMCLLTCAQSCSCLKVPCFCWRKAIFTVHLEFQVCSTQMTEGSHFLVGTQFINTCRKKIIPSNPKFPLRQL